MDPQTDIHTIVRKYQQYLLDLPNVTGVGVGKRRGRAVIKVFVANKVDASRLGRGELVPHAIEGYETDVEEIRQYATAVH